jgi:gliding motility-associated-like protein
MKKIFTTLFFFFFFHTIEAQKVNTIDIPKRKIENNEGKIITDSIELKNFYTKQSEEIAINLNQTKQFSPSALNAVQMCSNGSIEEFELVSGNYFLKDFEYGFGDPINPMQCKNVNTNSNLRIKQYNPNDQLLMASTVPSNYIDEYIGDIGAFDQFTMKINYKESTSTSGLVQAKRFKTDNEDYLRFNYKAVLQSIPENDHFDEQPYFKVRVIKNNGTVVSEFCLIGSPENCIFTQASNLEAGNIVLYTKKWQTGLLDISSIPNNEEFTIEFNASRCGLNGHFGYVYVDDICILHAEESLTGSIILDPLFSICPTLPISICGSFTIPNSGGITANLENITLIVKDEQNTQVYTSAIPTTLNLTTKRFCFDIPATALPNITTGNYNTSVTINFGLPANVSLEDCGDTSFESVTDSDANAGFDISFLNCGPDCLINLQTATLKLCDNNNDGKEFFNLSNTNNTIVGSQTGLSFDYFVSIADALSNTNAITSPTNYESNSNHIFVRVSISATCYKIIAIQLLVENPNTTISGILNVCSGSTTLTASPGSSYLWSNGSISQSINVSATGNYSVVVTNSNGCVSDATVTILPNQRAVLPTIEVNQPSCFIGTGTISVISPASEYSFDGGNTWITSNQVSNLSPDLYLIRIKTASGCESYDSPVRIYPFFSEFPDYIKTDPTECAGVGSITITTTGIEYSFDDGLTWSTNNTLTNAPVGVYKIRIKDVNGCISNYNNVILNGEFLDEPEYIKNNPYCGNLGSITITTLANEYSIDGGNTWQTSNVFFNLVADSYIIKIKNAQGCTSPNVYVYLNNLEQTYPEYEIDEAGCGEYATITIKTVADEYSFDGGSTWSINNVLPNLNYGQTFQIKVKKGISCFSYSTSIFINSTFRALPIVSDYDTLVCDDLNNSIESINLSSYNSNLVSNINNYTFEYYTTENGALLQLSNDRILSINNYQLNTFLPTIIYCRVIDVYNCYSIAKIKLILIASPFVSLTDIYYLCENYTVTIKEDKIFDSYLWSNGETLNYTILSQPGNYNLIVTENHNNLVCSTTHSFVVNLSNPATIVEIQINDWTFNNNSIKILVNGLGDYEYSIDGHTYQDSPEFFNLYMGELIVYVRDKHNCGITTKEIYILNYTQFFTPNGDGYNDAWRIQFSENELPINVKIYDRYGKILKVLNGIDSWDGTYNGRMMPSDDYWFFVTRSNGKIHKGHFTLKR